MITRFFQILVALALLLPSALQAQSLNCQSSIGSLFNGVFVLTPQMLNNNSNVPGGYSLVLVQNTPNGTSFQNAYTYACSNTPFVNNGGTINEAYFPVMLGLLNPNGVLVDTCTSWVHLIDSANVCNLGGTTIVDTMIIDASSCNTCDGYAAFYLANANGTVANNGPYVVQYGGITTTYNNGIFSFGNLCPGTHTFNIIDASGYQYTHTVVIGCNGGGGGTPVANCVSSLSLDLAPNGFAVVTAPMLSQNSSGSYGYIVVNNTMNGAYTFGCNDIGTHTITLVMVNQNNPNGGSVTSTCQVPVTITDTTNVCGGQSNVSTFIDSVFNASNCNTCDGQALVTGLLDANGNYIPVTTVVWSDGVVGNYRNDLCPFTPYTFVAYTSNLTVYTHTITVGCNSGNPSGGNCIDPALINPNAVCPAVYAPVCGCNGITYSNDCEAQANGVTNWTVGPCANNTPGFYVNVNSGGSGCDTAMCTGYAMLSVVNINNSSASGQYTYVWSDGFVGAVRQGLCAGVYMVDVTEANTGLSQWVTVVIGTQQGCVWPGDTDDNTVVNNFDLLPIALAYGESGPARPNATLGWYGQAAPNWNSPNPIANMPNYKHIDANGDGLIDMNDTQALSLNYGQSYVRSSSSLNGNIPLFVGSATAREGDRIGLPITFGTPAMVAQDIYGLAFTIHYDPTMVVAGSIDLDFAGSWLGSDLLVFTKDFPMLGLIEIAVARKDRQNVSNFGTLGTLNLTISDDILRNNTKDLALPITTVRVIDNANRAQGADVQNTGVVTVDLESGVENIEQAFDLSLFPNPAKETVSIRTNGTWIEDIQLFSATGQVLAQKFNVAADTYELNINNLPEGLYLVSVKTDKGIRRERLVVRR